LDLPFEEEEEEEEEEGILASLAKTLLLCLLLLVTKVTERQNGKFQNRTRDKHGGEETKRVMLL
jgi:hypothetical protein